MDRRKFIQNASAASALLSMGSLLTGAKIIDNEQTKITILHTNDVHSHIEPFPSSHGRNPNQGGVARRYTLIEQIRQENPNTLLLDAGDIFQGTPFFNYYGGELEFKLMSKLGYDVATIGNHDYDNGIDGLYKQLPHAKFQFVSANYDFKNTILEGMIKPYTILNKKSIKIGVFGIGIKLKGLVDPKLYKETRYLDPIEIAQETANKLKMEENCDLVICLSHLGYFYKKNPEKICDLKLAKATENIDLIIGGHTHTFLDKPTVLKNKSQEDVIVNQAGWAGLQLGRIDFIFDKIKNKSVHSKTISII